MIRKTEYQLEIILKIKELREANNVSQKELSNLLEVAPGLIGSIESPKFPHKYTLSQIYKICHYFNITIEQLFISEEDFSKDRETRPISDGFKKNNVNYWVFRDLCSIILHS